MKYYYVYKKMIDGSSWLRAIFLDEKDAKKYVKDDKTLYIKFSDSLVK